MINRFRHKSRECSLHASATCWVLLVLFCRKGICWRNSRFPLRHSSTTWDCLRIITDRLIITTESTQPMSLSLRTSSYVCLSYRWESSLSAAADAAHDDDISSTHQTPLLHHFHWSKQTTGKYCSVRLSAIQCARFTESIDVGGASA